MSVNTTQSPKTAIGINGPNVNKKYYFLHVKFKSSKDKLGNSKSEIRLFLRFSPSGNPYCAPNSSQARAAAAESRFLRSRFALEIKTVVIDMVSRAMMQKAKIGHGKTKKDKVGEKERVTLSLSFKASVERANRLRCGVIVGGKKKVMKEAKKEEK
ncbi:hypothetical protein [Absidia glauca]|uniref:Uncharacterized protein n=1 Tax=Absidia glauca TaxID=4829 RepID=A0A163MPT3_ABSGL|nr:hypothetical protein [Absidia glauca]